MHWNYVRYRPPRYQPPAAFRGVKFRLIERDAYLIYSVFEPLNALRMTFLSAARRVAGHDPKGTSR